MKTINVKASDEEDPKIETMYAYNGPYGIETTHDRRLAAVDGKYVKLSVSVSLMFPGTFEEWNKHIDYCIIDTLKNNGLTYDNIYGTFLK